MRPIYCVTEFGYAFHFQQAVFFVNLCIVFISGTCLTLYFITSKMYCNPDSWLCFYLNQSTNGTHKHQWE